MVAISVLLLSFSASLGLVFFALGQVRQKFLLDTAFKFLFAFALGALVFSVLGYHLTVPSEQFPSRYLPAFGNVWGAVKHFSGIEALALDMPRLVLEMSILFPSLVVAVSGIMERIRVGALLTFVFVYTLVIYPVCTFWLTSPAIFSALGLGPSLGFALGLWGAALTGLMGAMIVGPRVGRYTDEGPLPFLGASPLTSIVGFCIFWFAISGLTSMNLLLTGNHSVEIVLWGAFQTFVGGSFGLFGAAIVARALFGAIDINLSLQGGIAGALLVFSATTATSADILLLAAFCIGVLTILLSVGLDRARVDDPCGLTVVFGFPLFLGILINIFAGAHSIAGAFLGFALLSLWYALAAWVTWLIATRLFGIATAQEQGRGLDQVSYRHNAHPAFVPVTRQ